MTGRWGFGWMGSKNAIAKEIVDILPAGDVLVDLFAGGCAITHCAMLSGKWRRFIANDIKGTAVFFKQAIEGKVENLYEWITREDFFARCDHDVKVAACWSFGNSGRQYLWGYDTTDVKLAAFKMLTLPTIEERYAAYKKFITELGKLQTTKPLRQIECIERLRSLQSLEALNGVKSTQGACDFALFSVFACDYQDVPIPDGAVVYADPPYANTADYGTSFDTQAFWQWAREQPFPVFVSEYNGADGFTEIWSRQKTCTLSATCNDRQTTERLFVQDRFADAYKPSGVPQVSELFGDAVNL